jgi:serine/threonine protein phosphatase PrpC
MPASLSIRGDRKEQQDPGRTSCRIRERGGVALAVVADGMGGHTGGALAAEQVIHTARNNLEHFRQAQESARALLESSINEAHTC